MPQIVLVHLPLQMVPGMHHLMRHCILLVSPIPELVRAQQDAMIDVEPSALLARAHPANDVLVVDTAAQFRDLILQERHDGAVFEEKVAVVFASSAVGFLVYGVLLGKVVVLEGDIAVPGHAAQQDGEGVGPVVEVAVKLLLLLLLLRLRLRGRCGFGGQRAMGGLLGGIAHCWLSKFVGMQEMRRGIRVWGNWAERGSGERLSGSGQE